MAASVGPKKVHRYTLELKIQAFAWVGLRAAVTGNVMRRRSEVLHDYPPLSCK